MPDLSMSKIGLKKILGLILGEVVSTLDAQVLDAKTFKHLGLKLRGQNDVNILTIRNPNLTSDGDHVFGKVPWHFIFIDTADSNKIKVHDGSSGKVISENAAASTVWQFILDNIGSGGGKIITRQGNYDLTTVGLTLALTSTKHVDIQGGGNNTVLLYSGTGYAFNLTGTSSNQQYFQLHDIRFDGTTKTAGRHGIIIQPIGAISYLDNVFIKNMDDGLTTDDTNTCHFTRLRIQTTNTGIRTLAGATSNPNAIFMSDCNITNCLNEGIHLNSDNAAGAVVGIDRGSIDLCGTGIKVSGSLRQIWINNLWMEGNTVVDIHLAGQDTSNRVKNVYIGNTRMTGQIGTLTHAVKLGWAQNVTIDNCMFYHYSSAGILLDQDVAYGLDIRNPVLDGAIPTPFLLDSTSANLLTGANKAAGIITDAQDGQPRQSAIVNISSSGLVNGDVVILTGADITYATTTTADSPNPAVVSWPNAASNKPGAIVSNGLTLVNVDSATSLGDTLTTSTTTKKAKVNNSATDPKLIIGYAQQAIGGAGLCLTRII